MDTINHETLAALAHHAGWPSVSLYLTTHGESADNEQDLTRLRGLLDSAGAQLIGDGLPALDAAELMERATGLLTNRAFWQQAAEGVAVFAHPSETHILFVDTPLPEEVIVGDRFHIRPIALAYHGEQHFVALALDRKVVRLYAGNRSWIRELDIERVPDDSDLSRFMAELETIVTRAIGARGSVPLVLLGAEDLVAGYRAVNTYACLVDEEVLGEAGALSAPEVHKRVLEALATRFLAWVEADLAELRAQPDALVSEDPVEILTAAASGRVKSLFFDETPGPFGHFDRVTCTVSSVTGSAPPSMREQSCTEEPATCLWDLVDLAIAETILHGGEIHAFAGEAPLPHGVAAIIRP